jgi:hypothetical protein
MVRVLCPGGTLRGTTVVNGAGWRHDAIIRGLQRAGAFGLGGTWRSSASGWHTPDSAR